MKSLFVAVATTTALFSGLASAEEPAVSYEADCGMQTVPKPGKAPQTFAVAHVKIPAGQEVTIYKSDHLTYSADFFADLGDRPVYMLNLYLIDTTHGRKVTQTNVSSHDLQALQSLIAGLYAGPNPTAFCGTQM